MAETLTNEDRKPSPVGPSESQKFTPCQQLLISLISLFMRLVDWCSSKRNNTTPSFHTSPKQALESALTETLKFTNELIESPNNKLEQQSQNTDNP